MLRSVDGQRLHYQVQDREGSRLSLSLSLSRALSLSLSLALLLFGARYPSRSRHISVCQVHDHEGARRLRKLVKLVKLVILVACFHKFFSSADQLAYFS